VCSSLESLQFLNAMARSVRTIVAEALKLPTEERLALAAEIIDSVEGADPEWEAAWLCELDAREAQGVAQWPPWTEVRTLILERPKKS